MSYICGHKGFGIIYSPNRVQFSLQDGHPLDIEGTQAQLVETLYRRGKLTGTRLAEILNVTESHVIKLTKPLLEYGILKKEPSEIAHNAKLYSLTLPIFDEDKIEAIKGEFEQDLRNLVDRIEADKRTVIVYLEEVRQALSGLSKKERDDVLSDLRNFLEENVCK